MRLTEKDRKYLEWCEVGAALFSTCGKRQFMALVLSRDGRLVGSGYNGSPPGVPHCVDGYCPRLHKNVRSGSPYDSCIALHAEQNALLYSDRSLRAGGTLYVNGPSCSWCAKEIAGSAIARLVLIDDGTFDTWPASRNLLEQSGVEVDVDERF